jgi:hypothetical protein
MEYTKGEWKVESINGVLGSMYYVNIPGFCLKMATPTKEDAQLISAAPDMYEFIKREYAKGRISKTEADIILAKAEGK